MKAPAQKRPEKMLFIPHAEPQHREPTTIKTTKPVNKNNSKTQQTPGNEEDLISRVTRFLDSNVQFPIKKKITRHTEKWESMAHSKGGKNEQKVSLKQTSRQLYWMKTLKCPS